jgi:hypothetical protein
LSLGPMAKTWVLHKWRAKVKRKGLKNLIQLK